MKVTENATPHAIQITEYGFINAYLIRESDGFTLVDTCMSASEKILAVAQSAGVPIRRIIATHAHADHVGSVDALLAKLPPSTLFGISERSLPLLHKPPDKSLQPGEPQLPIKGSLNGVVSQPNHLLVPGELFGSLRVISTPGHIPGHLSFLDERDGTLYTGDELITFGRVNISGFCPWYFPLPNFGTWDKATALASARTLLDYPIQRYASGHGPVRDGGLARLQAAIAAAR